MFSTALEPAETSVKASESKPIEPIKSFSEIDCNMCSLSCKKGSQDSDEQRQAAIDFEDEIQDAIYIQAKWAKEPETESIIKNEGKYSYFYKEISDPTQTSFELTKLRPFTNYVSSVF